MIYLDELSLKREIILINNSKKMTSSTIEYSNFELLDKIQQKYNNENYNIRKSKIEEEFITELEKHFIRNYSKENFGSMILLLIKNILKKHCFIGYTQEWKEDFSIDAIEKILKYLHNFNPRKISERSGRKVKAFAYLTQIITQAFISVINKRNDEKRKALEYKTVSYSSLHSESLLSEILNAKENNSSMYDVNNEKDEKFYKEIKVKTLEEIPNIIDKYSEGQNSIRIIYPDEIKSIPIDMYKNIINNKPDNLELIVTKEYKQLKEDKIKKELSLNNVFTDFGEDEELIKILNSGEIHEW